MHERLPNQHDASVQKRSRFQEILILDSLTYHFNPIPQFDLVYYDAFAPGKQPEMWTDEILEKVAESIKIGGILITYSAKGSVRRALSAAGLMMERIPGPVGKKEILRGKKSF